MNKEQLKTIFKKSLFFLSDKHYICLYYRLNLKRKLNYKNPSTLNEKLQWMKMNYRFPLMSIVSDKSLVREFVKNIIGAEYIVPSYGERENFNDIDFSKLPTQFVLKCNHDSGGLIICENKDTFNKNKAKKKINKCLRSDFFAIGREYQYKGIKPRIICEKFLCDNGKVPMDYKIYCFNGKVDCIMVCWDRFSNNNHRAQYRFFDKERNFLKYMKIDCLEHKEIIKKPKNLKKMLVIAEKLSKDFVFARIDLYNIDGQIYFGEITLSPNAGFDPDLTYEADKRFGDMLSIPYWDKINHNIF